jgi:hypothetical protein
VEGCKTQPEKKKMWKDRCKARRRCISMDVKLKAESTTLFALTALVHT